MPRVIEKMLNHINYFETYKFNSYLLERFASGELREDWYRMYPFIFDEVDLETARNQTQYHYFEWQTAINIYEKYSYLSLVEKYQFQKHKNQFEIFSNLVPANVIELLQTKQFGNQQLPDLFVYSPDRSNWFFCEVKGNNDKLSLTQENLFNKLTFLTNNPVRLIKYID